MTLCLLPTAALADSGTEYDVWVGGVRVTSENASSVTGSGITGTVSYDTANNTLTLDDASVTGVYTDGNNNTYGIYADGSVTINLVGVNTVIGAYSSGDSYGVYCFGALALNGSGSLNAVAGTADGTSSGVCGDSITVSAGATITAIAGTAGRSCGTYGNSVTVIGALTATAGSSTGISCGVFCGSGSVTVESTGVLTATGGSAASSCGVYSNSGTVSVTGGVVAATGGKASDSSYGVYGGSAINVNNSVNDGAANDGLLIAKSGSAATSNATNTAPACGTGSAALTGAYNEDFAVWGVSGTYPTANILTSTLDLSAFSADYSHWSDTTGGWKTATVNGVNTLTLKNVIINAPDADSGAYGIKLPSNADVSIVLEGVNVVSAGSASNGSSCGVGGSQNISLSSTGGGTLYTLAGTASGSGSSSCGVSGAEVTLSGTGTVTATGGTASGSNGCSYGVYGYRVTLSGTVTATGGSGNSCSYGVSSGSGNGDISGTVTAIGGTANNNNSCGVNGIISSSGIVTAVGGAAGNSSCGVFYGGDGAITYSGTVTAVGGAAVNSSYGVDGYSGATLSGAVTASGGTASYGSCGVYSSSGTIIISGTITATGGTVTGASGDSYGVHGNSVTVEVNGVLTATGSSSTNSYGVYGNSGSVTLSGIVTATGSTAGTNSYGVFSNSGTITLSGNVIATGGTAGSCSYGVYGKGIALSGTVTATGGTAAGTSGKSCGVYSSDAITLSGTVTATGGTATGTSGGSYGVFGSSVTVEATGTVTAIGGTAAGASGASVGVFGSGSVNLSGSVIVSGGTSGNSSYGVYGASTISLSGSVIVTGGTAGSASYGVFSSSDVISITGGTTTAISGTVTIGTSRAMNKAPDLTGYTSNHDIIVSANADGSGASTWDNSTSLTTYKYLKIVALYALTVNLDGGSGTTANSDHMAGDVVSIDAGTKSGYAFSGWTATGGGTFASASSAATTYTMPAGAATITANWTANSSGGTSASTTTVPVSGGSGAVNLSASVSGSTATVSATDAQLQRIGSGTETGAVVIDASALKVDAAIVPAKVVSAVQSAEGSTGLAVILPTGTVTLNETALAAVAGKGDVKLSVETVSNAKLTDTQKAVLGTQAGSAVIVDVDVYVNGTRTSTFGDGKISVSVPYTPKSGENADSVTVWFIKDDGTIEPKNGVYNAAAGCVEFTTEHLSQYLIVDFPFTDVAENSWYYGSVAYAYNNGLFAGISDTTFSPDTAMTRQMIWMVLARMDGKTPANMDTARTWAMENGISDGSNPKNSITREQMATILYRYAQYKSYDTTQGGMTIREFTDYDSISEYALPALAWMVNAGLMQGSNNNIMPSGSATRAQIATILQRFCQDVAE